MNFETLQRMYVDISMKKHMLEEEVMRLKTENMDLRQQLNAVGSSSLCFSPGLGHSDPFAETMSSSRTLLPPRPAPL